jgi:alpha-L-fucosidase
MNTKKQSEERMDSMWGEMASDSSSNEASNWFTHDRYSMFIHWGLYSLIGGEWKGKTYYGIGEWIMHPSMANIPVDEVKALAGKFNPIDYDAKKIVGLAKAAGMRCIVITAKHHEGFAMYNSSASDFTITKATPFKRDLLTELSQECLKEGIRLGFYYSQYQDWIEPHGGSSKCILPEGFEVDFDNYFDNKVIPQVTELLNNYGPISVVWFDTPGRMTAAHSQRLVDLVHKLQPNCLVNSRVGNGLGDYSTLGDMEIPTITPKDGLFECIDTTNNSWSYAYYDSNWKPASLILKNLIRTIARGVNFMINIGPDGRGNVPEPATKALTQAGDWIRSHEEAIYGCTASPFPPFSWGDCTVKGNNLFVHVFAWPKSGKLKIAALKGNVVNATVLQSNDKIEFNQIDDQLHLMANINNSETPITIKLSIDSKPEASHQSLTIDSENITDLPAEYATLESVTLNPKHWMETFGEWKKTDNLVNWKGKEAKASWDINNLEHTTQIVTVEYACDADNEGSEWELTLGDKKCLFCALKTGQEKDNKRMRYRKVDVGILEMNKIGQQSLDFHPALKGMQGEITLKGISLSPWK